MMFRDRLLKKMKSKSRFVQSMQVLHSTYFSFVTPLAANTFVEINSELCQISGFQDFVLRHLKWLCLLIGIRADALLLDTSSI